jgi:hypothetical protein
MSVKHHTDGAAKKTINIPKVVRGVSLVWGGEKKMEGMQRSTRLQNKKLEKEECGPDEKINEKRKEPKNDFFVFFKNFPVAITHTFSHRISGQKFTTTTRLRK